MGKGLVVAIWVAATALTTVIAWQIVAAAGEQVSPGPLTPVAPTVTSTSSTANTSTSTTSSSTTSTTAPGSTTSTTTSGSTTSVTTSPAWQVRSIPTSGGTVVVSYRPGEVALDAATPAPGFSVEVDKAGPPEVDVEFEGESEKVRVRAEWDGQLVVEVDEDDDGG